MFLIIKIQEYPIFTGFVATVSKNEKVKIKQKVWDICLFVCFLYSVYFLYLWVAPTPLYPFLNDYPTPGEGGGYFFFFCYSEWKGCKNNVPKSFYTKVAKKKRNKQKNKTKQNEKQPKKQKQKQNKIKTQQQQQQQQKHLREGYPYRVVANVIWPYLCRVWFPWLWCRQ